MRQNATTGPHLTLSLVSGELAICRLDAQATIPAWADGSFYSITRTDDELSIVCDRRNIPGGVPCESGWRALRVKGQLDFALTGVLASLTVPLAGAGISLFAISTFDTDYILVKETNLRDALAALKQAGHIFEEGPGS
jgi:uncharacterized protein